MVICLERSANLHMAQLMSLPLTVSCFSKIQIGFTFLVLADPGGLGKRAVKRVCVFHTLSFGPLCLGHISQLVDTVVGYFCTTFLYFLYSFFCNLQCTLFVTNPADWLP